MHENSQKIYVGIDVSKAYLNVYIHPADNNAQFSNDNKGIKLL